MRWKVTLGSDLLTISSSLEERKKIDNGREDSVRKPPARTSSHMKFTKPHSTYPVQQAEQALDRTNEDDQISVSLSIGGCCIENK